MTIFKKEVREYELGETEIKKNSPRRRFFYRIETMNKIKIVKGVKKYVRENLEGEATGHDW